MSGFGSNDSYDSLGGGGVQGELTVGTTPVEVKVGVSRLDGRRVLHMMAKSNSIYWGYTSGVTTTTGTRIFKDQFVSLPINENMGVWVVADGAGRTMSIAEIAERG